MADPNDGKPYHIPHGQYGVPKLWPEAEDGDRVRIHNGRTIREYEMSRGVWCLLSTAYVGD